MNNRSEEITALTWDVIGKLKSCGPQWETFLKAASKHQEIMKQSISASFGFIEAFNGVAALAANAKGATGALGNGLLQIGTIHKDIEARRDQIANAFMTDLIVPIQRRTEMDKKNIARIEAQYSSQLKDMKENVKKAEKEAEKLNKQAKKSGSSGNVLETSQAVQDRVKELEKMKQDTLRTVLIEERKKYCYFLMNFATIMKHEIDAFTTASETLNKCIGEWMKLAASPEELPPASEALITDVPAGSDPNVPSAPPSSLPPKPYDPIYDDHFNMGLVGTSIVKTSVPKGPSAPSPSSSSSSSVPPPPPPPPPQGGSIPPPPPPMQQQQQQQFQPPPPPMMQQQQPTPPPPQQQQYNTSAGTQAVRKQSTLPSAASAVTPPPPPIRGEPMAAPVNKTLSSSNTSLNLIPAPPPRGGSSMESPSTARSPSPTPPPPVPAPAPPPVQNGKPLVAVFSYQADGTDRISFKEGDEIIGEGVDEDGWMFGAHVATGRKGWFPTNYTAPRKVNNPPPPPAPVNINNTISARSMPAVPIRGVPMDDQLPPPPVVKPVANTTMNNNNNNNNNNNMGTVRGPPAPVNKAAVAPPPPAPAPVPTPAPALNAVPGTIRGGKTSTPPPVPGGKVSAPPALAAAFGGGKSNSTVGQVPPPPPPMGGGGPPPPPPPPPMGGGVPPPPPPAALGGKSSGGGGGSGGGSERGALLGSIQKGTKLKKTVTVDKSAPVGAGRVV